MTNIASTTLKFQFLITSPPPPNIKTKLDSDARACVTTMRAGSELSRLIVRGAQTSGYYDYYRSFIILVGPPFDLMTASHLLDMLHAIKQIT